MKNILKIFALIMFATMFTMCSTAIIDEEETPVIEEDVTYSEDIFAIMFNYCLTCHAGNLPSANLDLQTYEAVRAATENGHLLDRVEDSANPMPPSGLIGAADRAKIKKWVEGGYKQ